MLVVDYSSFLCNNTQLSYASSQQIQVPRNIKCFINAGSFNDKFTFFNSCVLMYRGIWRRLIDSVTNSESDTRLVFAGITIAVHPVVSVQIRVNGSEHWFKKRLFVTERRVSTLTYLHEKRRLTSIKPTIILYYSKHLSEKTLIWVCPKMINPIIPNKT